MAEETTYSGEEDSSPKLDNDQAKLAKRWLRRIVQSEKYFKDYMLVVEKIVKRYRDERQDMQSNNSRRFNLLWSNIQTLQPAVYTKEPKVNVSRRYLDRDPIARITSMVIERSVSFEMDVCDFQSVMLQNRDDYLLAGRGIYWQRYEGKMVTVPPDVDPDTGLPANDPETGQPIGKTEKLEDESAPGDYVNWDDFLHDPKPIWKKVKWVGRKVLVTKREAKENGFDPECISRMKFTIRRMEEDKEKYTRHDPSKRDQEEDSAKVYEIWDKTDKQVIWVSKDVHDKVLKLSDDFLELTDFFPCPPPLYATITNDSLIPRPDYVMYQDQAREVDNLTLRIDLLTKAIAVRGAYDSSAPKLKDLLQEKPENFLVPVDNFAAFAEKGGIPGAISFVPIDVVIKVIGELITKRALLVQDIYQITGISDIVRGQTQPHETATAQSIKGNFATLRLEDRRVSIAKFSRNSLRLMAEVIAEHFEPDTIRRISGFDVIAEVESLREMYGDQAVDQLWGMVMSLLRDQKSRSFKLDVETDSTIQMDRYEEQQRRTEFLTAVTTYIKEMAPLMQQAPMLAPLIGKMLLFGVRGFNVGRELESEIEGLVAQFVGQGQQQQQQPPDPETVKAQADVQATQQGMQIDAAKAQQDMQQEDQMHRLEMKNSRDKMRLQLQQAEVAVKAAKMKAKEKPKTNGDARQ